MTVDLKAELKKPENNLNPVTEEFFKLLTKILRSKTTEQRIMETLRHDLLDFTIHKELELTFRFNVTLPKDDIQRLLKRAKRNVRRRQRVT